ncbi:MAG: hypothetical protein ACREL7_11175 [Longimicrobiales bacterium]
MQGAPESHDLIGRSEDEVVAAGVMEYDAEWGANADRFVRAVYQSLARR